MSIKIEKICELRKNYLYKVWIPGNNKRNEKKSFYVITEELSKKLNLGLGSCSSGCPLFRICRVRKSGEQRPCDYVISSIYNSNQVFPIYSRAGRKCLNLIRLIDEIESIKC